MARTTTVSADAEPRVVPGRRLAELDLVRMGAALAVVGYHFVPDTPGAPKGLQVWTSYGFLGVELFFFVSGFVILQSLSHGSARRFVASRASRLYPAYWAGVLVAAAVSFTRTRHLKPFQIVANLSMGQRFVHLQNIDTVYWTLAVELTFYMLMWAVLATRQLSRIRPILAAWLVGSTLLEVIRPVDELRLLLATQWAPFFVFGAALALLRQNRRDWFAWGLWASGLAVSLWQSALQVTATNLQNGYHINRLVGMAIVLALALMMTAVAFDQLAALGRPWMVALGAVSYPLYLIHHPVGLLLLHHGVAEWWPLTLVGTVAAALAVSWLINRGVERSLRPVLDRSLNRLLGRFTLHSATWARAHASVEVEPEQA